MHKELLIKSEESEPDWLKRERQEAFQIFIQQQIGQSAYADIGIDFNRAISEAGKTGIICRGGDKTMVRDITAAIMENQELRGFLSQKLVSDDGWMAAMNTACFNSGSFIRVPKNTSMRLFRNLVSGNSGFTRTIIVVEEGAGLELIDEFTSGADNYFHNDMTELHIKDNARVSYTSIQNLGDGAAFISCRKAIVGRNSKISWSIIGSGSKFSKSRRETILDAEGAEVTEAEVILTRGSQRMDSDASILHNARNTRSWSSTRGVLDGSSRQTAHGMVRIGEHASGTNSFLEEHSILLSKDAKADSMPALEILTNDVRAKHAATCSQIDDERLFYIMARGLSREDSKKLIVEGFIKSAISRMPEQDEIIGMTCEKWLQELCS